MMKCLTRTNQVLITTIILDTITTSTNWYSLLMRSTYDQQSVNLCVVLMTSSLWTLMITTVVRGRVGKKIILKIKTEILRKFFFQFFFLHGEKENFEEYSLFLEFAKLTFAILINYSAEKNRTCPRATVLPPPNSITSCEYKLDFFNLFTVSYCNRMTCPCPSITYSIDIGQFSGIHSQLGLLFFSYLQWS
jgi:hypothetical protein